MRRTILGTGGTGQIGQELARLHWPEGVNLHLPPRTELDIGSAQSIETLFARERFAAVINCAAYTAVDKAEDDRDAAFLANAQAVTWLAEATQRAGIPLIHVSTDYVFGGSKASPYTEDDPVAPLGVYGGSNSAGKIAARNGNPRALVLRTAWVVSAHGSNFLKTMLRVAATSPKVRVVADQFGCPTAAADIAATLRTIALRMIDDPAAPCGTYHFVNDGEASWCDLARHIFASSARAGGPMADVEAITTADYPTRARRPANSRLSTRRLRADYGIVPRGWHHRSNEQHEGHYPGRRIGDAAPSDDARHLQATHADLRQADDLLSAVDADARGHPRYPRHLGPG